MTFVQATSDIKKKFGPKTFLNPQFSGPTFFWIKFFFTNIFLTHFFLDPKVSYDPKLGQKIGTNEFSYCQAQLQLSVQLKAELALFPLDPATHPPVKVYF